MLAALVDLVVRTPCVGCGEDVPFERWPAWCHGCSRGLPRGLWGVGSVPGTEAVWGWSPYEGPVGEAIRRAKYGRDPRAAATVAAGLASAVQSSGPWGVDAVVGVPQAWDVTLRRGYSPVEVLASAVGRVLEVPVVPALRRLRGERLASLPRGQRASALAGHIEARRPVAGRMLLVDDVVTTGLTMSTCARVLLDAGADDVVGLCAASPSL